MAEERLQGLTLAQNGRVRPPSALDARQGPRPAGRAEELAHRLPQAGLSKQDLKNFLAKRRGPPRAPTRGERAGAQGAVEVQSFADASRSRKREAMAPRKRGEACSPRSSSTAKRSCWSTSRRPSALTWHVRCWCPRSPHHPQVCCQRRVTWSRTPPRSLERTRRRPPRWVLRRCAPARTRGSSSGSPRTTHAAPCSRL